jgi:hypothetical protein
MSDGHMTEEMVQKLQAQQLRYALNALQRIAKGQENDPQKFAGTAIRHIFGAQIANETLGIN